MPHVNITKEDRLFANISNDFSLKGSGLEGGHSPEYSRYLLDLLTKIDLKNPELAPIMEDLKSDLESIAAPDRFKAATQAKNKQSVTFYSGWNDLNLNDASYNIIATLKYSPEGDLLLFLYDTQVDRKNFAQKASAKGMQYATAKVFRISKNNISNADLQLLTTALTKPSHGITDYTLFYLNLQETLFKLSAKEENPQNHKISFATVTRAATSGWKTLMAFVRPNSVMKYEIKLAALVDYYDYIVRNERLTEPLVQQQLLLACQNLSRLIKKLQHKSTINDEQISKGLIEIEKITNSINPHIAAMPDNNATKALPHIAEIKIPIESLNTGINLNVEAKKPNLTIDIANFAAPNFDKNNIIASFAAVKEVSDNENLNQLYRKILVENFINSIELPLDIEAFKAIIADKTEVVKLTKLLISLFDFINLNSGYRKQNVRYEATLAKFTIRHILEHIAQNFLDIKRYRFKEIKNNDPFGPLAVGPLGQVIAEIHYKSGRDLETLRAEVFLSKILHLFIAHTGAAKELSPSKTIALNSTLKARCDYLYTNALRISDNLKRLEKDAIKPWMENSNYSPAIDVDFTMFKIAFNDNDPTMDFATATELFKALNSMRVYFFEDEHAITYFHDPKARADINAIDAAEPPLSYKESDYMGSFKTITSKAISFVPLISDADLHESTLLKLSPTLSYIKTEPVTHGAYRTAEDFINILASHPKHTMAHREFLYDLYSIYRSKNSAISFIYEAIIKYADKISSSYFQNVIFANLFRNGNIKRQISNDPQGLEDLIDLLTKKVYQFYSPDNLNNNLLFMLRITTMLESYLLRLTNERDILATKPSLNKLTDINNVIANLIVKHPNNLDLHIIRILRLQGQTFNNKIDDQNIIDIFTSFLMLHIYSYIVADDLVDPWLYKTVALDIIIAKQDAIINAFARDSHLVAQIVTNVSARKINPATIQGTYPNFVAEFVDGTSCNINLLDGLLQIADNNLRDTPSQVYNTELYQYHFGQQVFVGTFEENHSFTFEDTKQTKHIYKLDGHLLRYFQDGEHSAYYEYSPSNSRLLLSLPASMLDKKHDLWVGQDNFYITDVVSKQPIYKLSNEGAIDLINNAKLLAVDSNNPFIKQLTTIENEQFIEVWHSQAQANEYSLKLPRYNLEFISKDHGKTFIWKNDPRYQLIIPTNYDLLKGYQQYLVLEAIDKTLELPELAIIPQQKLVFDINTQAAALNTTKSASNPKDHNYFASAQLSVVNINNNKLDPITGEQFLHLAYVALTANQITLAQQMLEKAALTYSGTQNELHWLKTIITSERSQMVSEEGFITPYDKSLATQDAIKAFAVYLYTANSAAAAYLQDPTNKKLLDSMSNVIAKYYNNLNNIPRKLRLSVAQELSILQQIKSDVTTKRLWQLQQNLITDATAPPEYMPEDFSKIVSLNPNINAPVLLKILQDAKNLALPEFDSNSDYNILLESPALILNAILNINKLEASKKASLDSYIQAMTMIFFNPDGTSFDYLRNYNINILSNEQIQGIQALLVIFNYLTKYPNKVSASLGNHKQLDDYIDFIVKQREAAKYKNENSLSKLKSALGPSIPSLATLFSALPHYQTNEQGILLNILEYNLKSLLEISLTSPITIDYTKPLVEQPEIVFPALQKLPPKKLAAPQISAHDPILQDMQQILTTAGLTLAKIDESIPSYIESSGDSYAAIMRNEFNNDYQIGQAQNAAKAKLHKTFAAELTVESLNKIHTTTQQLVKDLNHKLTGFNDRILKAANFISNEKKQEAAIELNSGHKHKLAFADLLKLFVLQDEAEYLQQTFLDSAQIAELQQQIFDYLLLETELQHLQRISQLADKIQLTQDLQEQTALKEELAGVFESSRSYDVNKNFAVLVFEYLDNKLIRKTQAKYLAELLKTNDGKYNNILAHIIMGGGKSKILLPLLAQMKASRDNLTMLVVSREMYQTNLADLSKLSKELFKQQLYEFEFSRDTKCDGDFFKNWYYKLLQIMQDGSYILTTPESLQSMDLKFFELLRYGNDSQEEGIQYLKQILLLLKTNGDLIIDEVDQNLQTRKELNYSIGSKTHINEAYPDLISDAVEFFDYLEQNFTISEIIAGKRLLLTPAAQTQFINNVTSKLINDPNSVLYKTLLTSTVTELNAQQKEELQEYLCDKEKALPEFINAISSDADRTANRLAFFRENLSSLLVHTLSKHKNEHYGLRHTPGDVFKSNIAIPYIGAKTPSKSSEFLAILEQLNYTLQAQMGEPISTDIFKLILTDFYKKYALALNDSISDAEKVQQSFNTLAGLDIRLKDITFAAKQLTQIYAQITPEKHQVLQQFALTNFILPSIDFNEIQLRSTPQNLVRIPRSVQSFTGTPFNNRTLLGIIKFEPSLSSGTDGQTVDNILKNTTAIHKVADHDSLANIFAQLSAKNNIHALIDQGAYCRYMQNVDVAYALREIYHDSEIKYILFFNEDNKLAAMPVDRSLPIKVIGSSDPADIYAAIQTKPEHYFTYYDQRHATGVDIKQTSLAHALVTISETVILRDLLQAAMRMRGLANKQKLEFIIPHSIAGQINSANDIIDYCLQNQIETLVNDHYAAAKQQISAIITDEVRLLILKSADIDAAKQILQHCNHLFFTENIAALFEQCGVQLELLPTNLSLQQFAEAQIASLQQLLSLNIINAEHKAKLEHDIAKVIEQIVPVCKPEEYANAMIDYAQEQEREQQLQQEQEQELEFQIENHTAEDSKPHAIDSEKLTEEQIVSILQQTNNDLISLNAAFDSASIKRNWLFKDNLFQTKGMAVITDEQRNRKHSLLDYKREIYDILVVRNPQTGKSTYVCLTPSDAQEIIYYCQNNPTTITAELKIVTINGHSHYNFRSNSITANDAEYKLAMQQLGFYNGDIGLCLKDQTWLQEDFASKQKIFMDYIIKSHPSKLALLAKAPELFGKRATPTIANAVSDEAVKKSFKDILWDILSFPFRMIARAVKAFIGLFTTTKPETINITITTETNNKLKELSPKLAEMVIKRFQTRIANAKNAPLAEQQKILADWEKIAKPLLDNDVKKFCDAVEAYIKHNKKASRNTNNMLSQYDATDQPVIAVQDRHVIINEIRALRKAKQSNRI